jgi:hypothetical protein
MIQTQSLLPTRPDREKQIRFAGTKLAFAQKLSPGFFHSFGSAIGIFWIDKVKTEIRAAARFACLFAFMIIAAPIAFLRLRKYKTG